MPVILFSMVAHEYAHGYAALRQGDPTAYQLGRLTWNPIKHIDPLMTIVMPVMTYFFGSFIFGGAKPVPVVPRNYRNYRRGDIIVSMAGIVVNLGLYVVAALLLLLFGLLGRAVPALTDTLAILQVMMVMGVQFNLMLAMFNLLPLPPLDGSHVMKYLLPPAWALRYQQLGMYGILILLFLMGTGIGRGLLSTWLYPVFFIANKTFTVLQPFFLQSEFTELFFR
ncbi:MAG: site-2 protease family protein [Gemmatimonadetes bacterium]|nr:site-2 protease family protein [Gemmatimonadota bacterium]